MREEMGFIPRQARWTQRPADQTLAHHHVLIVGAGVCAIALAVALDISASTTLLSRRTPKSAAHGTSTAIRLRRRHAEPFLFLLLRIAKRLDRYFCQRGNC